LNARTAITILLVAAFAITAAAAADKVQIDLTYPNGPSPKVFTVGWTFGAKAVLDPGTPQAKDISSQVKWSGSGIFSPKTGAVSHPSFSKAGKQTIVISVTVDKKVYKREFTIETVIPKHATVGDQGLCSADSHGCPACPHVVIGPIKTGNPKVKINGKPVACVGDTGIHRACCGPNTFRIVSGDPDVKVDGKCVAKHGDKTQHCGGVGIVVDKSLVLSTKYSGSFSGGASGKASFTVDAGKVVGTFTGGHASEGGGVVNVELKGTYNAASGEASGTMSGTATYVGLDKKTATAKVKGTFKGQTNGNTFGGTWSVVASGIEDRAASGSFTANRAAAK
jgi:uncharacterized Zn-binding protein involved in type VI secretion